MRRLTRTRSTPIGLRLLAGFLAGWMPSIVANAAEPRPLSTGPAATALCEALQQGVEGNREVRDLRLAELLEVKPDYSPAHWQSGQVREGKQWVKYDQPIQKAEYQVLLAEYSRLRDQGPLSVANHRELADWCRDHGLADRERFHLYSILQREPNDYDAHHRLGDTPNSHGWTNPATVAAFQTVSREQEKATLRSMTTWSQVMKQTATWLPKQDSSGRRQAIEKFRLITDPEAIPAMETVLLPVGAEAAELCIEQWGRMKSPEAAFALAQLAVYHPNEKLAEKAAKQLRDKPEDSYAPLLLSALCSPIEHHYEYLESPDGQVLAKHLFTREFEDRKLEKQQTTTYATADFRRRELPAGRERLDAASIAATVKQENAKTEQINGRVYATLSTATGDEVPREATDCWNWWYDRNEVYVTGPKPTVYQNQTSTVTIYQPRKYDCLAAGTPIWTDCGLVAVEKIKPGDRVLSQDPKTGELAYKIVYQTTIRPPEQLVKIETSSGSISASGGHPFWIIGTGWVRARRLPVASRLYGLGDETRVAAVANDQSPQPSYNLLVADFHTYFAGEQRILSHDNTVRQPVSASVPGLLEK
jgi:hypothetical protein